jgi:hypothetical protein
MSSQHSVTMDASTLREQLMAPQPMPRFAALHALESEIGRLQGSAHAALANAAARFVERGIPYYSAHAPHYQAWVSKAVSYWEKLRADTRAH